MFDSEKELAEFMVPLFKRKLRSNLTWEPPYDEHDVAELWDMFTKETSGGQNKPRVLSKNTKPANNLTAFIPQLESREDFEAFKAFAFAEHNVGIYYRNKLGIDKPLKVHEVKSYFQDKGWLGHDMVAVLSKHLALDGSITENGWVEAFVESAGTRAFPLPISNHAFGLDFAGHKAGIRYCLIEYSSFNSENKREKQLIDDLYDHVLSSSLNLHMHPSLVLMMILCDLPIYLDWIQLIQYPPGALYGSSVEVNIRDNRISPSLIKRIYSISRKLHSFRERGNSLSIGWPRSRPRTERVIKLVDFVNKNNNKDWSNRLNEWNNTYPGWQYASLNSLRTVYLRAVSQSKENASTNEDEINQIILQGLIKQD